jgi:hypothetical protein
MCDMPAQALLPVTICKQQQQQQKQQQQQHDV